MWIYIARRLLWLPFLLLAASLITFMLGRVAPGDPVQVMLGDRYDPESQVTKKPASAARAGQEACSPILRLHVGGREPCGLWRELPVQGPSRPIAAGAEGLGIGSAKCRGNDRERGHRASPGVFSRPQAGKLAGP